MRTSLGSSVVIALGLVVAALLLRDAPNVEAAGAACQIRTFRLSFNPDDTRTVGTVPAGHTLVLHDFYSANGHGTYDILGNGVPIMPTIEVGTSGPQLFSFSAGIPVPAGTVLSIHRAANNCCASELFVGCTVQ
ncbi:MAG: hypothetical protein HYR85_10925 [Planctomycetes bacterium]|nr:hypothetical protein [Planctomycetota bacterium]MBI3847272.1 hypothetical protein [Planctomycetota bacterium]